MTLYQATNIERYLYGYVPDGNKCTVVLKTDSGTFKAVTDEEGYFTASVKLLKAGSSITVHAYKSSGGTTNKGYPKTYSVEDANEMYTEIRDVKIHIDKVTDKDKKISGKWTEIDSKVYICADGREYVATTDDDGKYSVDIKARLKIGTPVYVLSRSTRGSVKGMRKYNVTLGAPINPVIVGRVTIESRYVKVYTKENCSVTLKIGARKYVKNSGVYNRGTNRYYYTFKVARAKAGVKVRAYAKIRQEGLLVR